MKRLVFLCVCFCLCVAWGFAQSNLQPAAIVNLIKSEPITVGMVKTEVEKLEKASGQILNEQQRREVLDVMINERLALQAAERDKITVSENEVNAQMSQLREQMAQVIGRQPTEAEFTSAVKNETGLEMPAYRDQLRRQLIVQKYLMAKKEDLFKNIKIPSDTEILNTYNLHRTRFVRPETVRFSMIQVPFGADAAAKTRARETADRLAKEIGTSASRFDEVVLRGQTPNAGYQAGDGGYLPRNAEAAQIVGQEFINIAFNLKQGEVSRIIEGRLGYQIVKITETYVMKNLELDDIFQLGSRATVREFIGNGLLQERQMETLQKATEELVTELRAGRTFQVFENNLKW